MEEGGEWYRRPELFISLTCAGMFTCALWNHVVVLACYMPVAADWERGLEEDLEGVVAVIWVR